MDKGFLILNFGKIKHLDKWIDERKFNINEYLIFKKEDGKV